jgi:hypothetical protein
MPSSTLAGVITAIAAVFTAISLVITALAAWNRSKKVERKIDEVHTIVNQQRTDMQRYIRAQTALLRANGIEPPIDQSIDPEEVNK